MTRVLALAAALASAAAPAIARPAPVAQCHCFQEREWKPETPASADAYILATTRSSLLSAAFGPGKASLVRAVMTGSQPDDLWIANWTAARDGGSAPALLERKVLLGSWKAALEGASARALGPAFSAALAAGEPDARLAAIAVDDVLTARLGVAAAAVRAGREAGASSAELIVAAVLASRTKQTPAELVKSVRAGRAWGELLNGAGLAPKDLDTVVRQLVR